MSAPAVSDADFAAEYTAVMGLLRAASGGASEYEDWLIDAATDALLDARKHFDPARGTTWRQWARVCVCRAFAGAPRASGHLTGVDLDTFAAGEPAHANSERLATAREGRREDLVRLIVVQGATLTDAARALGITRQAARKLLIPVARRLLTERGG